jgi:hypothetical protein
MNLIASAGFLCKLRHASHKHTILFPHLNLFSSRLYALCRGSGGWVWVSMCAQVPNQYMIDNVVRHTLLGQVSSRACYHALERVVWCGCLGGRL